MNDWRFWFLLALYFAIPAAIFIGRNWIKASIEQSVRAAFEAKLEGLRSELRRSEEELKSELRQKETQLAALRDGILTGRAQRQALVERRRLDAIDRLWAAFMALAPLTVISQFMAVINYDVIAADPRRNDPKYHQFFQTIFPDQQATLAKLSETPAKKEQSFVSDLAWAYFSAYQTILITAYMKAKVLETGIENPNKYFKEEPVKDLLKAALPYYVDYIDKYGASGYHYLLDELEKRLLAELQKMLLGEDQDATGVEQAAKIMGMVEKATAQQTEQQVGAAQVATGAIVGAAGVNVRPQ